MSTLVEKAKASEARGWRSRIITDEHIELALAWARDEISARQAAEAIYGKGKRASMNIYTLFSRALAEHIRRNRI